MRSSASSAGSVSATNSGSDGGSAATMDGPMVNACAAEWQVPHVLPLPSNVSSKKMWAPSLTTSDPVHSIPAPYPAAFVGDGKPS